MAKPSFLLPKRDKTIGFVVALIRPLGVCALILWLGAMATPLLADGTNAAPVQSQPATAGPEDFGQYLADHQADLAPFFTNHIDELVKEAVPLLMGLMCWVIAFTALLGWGIDVLMGRGYAIFFAPAFARFRPAIIYATGQLVISLVFTLAIGTVVVYTLAQPYGGWICAGLTLVFVAMELVAQVVWVIYVYRSNLAMSSLFYLAIIVVHLIAGGLISIPVIGARTPGMAADFVNNTVTPKIRAEIESTQRQLAGAQSARDDAQAKVTDVQNQIAQAQADQEQLHKEIEEKKNSDAYMFSQIVKARAQGDLSGARDRFTDFLTKFPSSPLIETAKAQLDQVNGELNVQATQKKQQEDDAIRAAAQARADLLARAGQGQATLSEMRQALYGKSRDEVKDLFGQPSETASDSWSYQQQMILNPLTNEKHGLTIYFIEGAVQSVDYYGNGAAR